MKRIFSILIAILAITPTFSQTDTLTPASKARYKISRIRDNSVRAITPTDFRGALNSVADLAEFNDKPYSPDSFSGIGIKTLRKNIASGINRLTQSMVSDSNTRYEVPFDYNLNGSTIILPRKAVLDFSKGGSVDNGIVEFNETSRILNGDDKRIKGRNASKMRYAKSTWIDWTTHVGDGTFGDWFEIDLTEDLVLTAPRAVRLSNNNSTLIIRGNGHTITSTQYLQFSANNVLIENAKIVLQIGSQINFNHSNISKSTVTLRGCEIRNEIGNKREFYYGIPYSLTPDPEKGDFNFVMDKCVLDNIPVHLGNAGYIHLNNIVSIQGVNNADNYEQVHISNPLLKHAVIENSLFYANGYSSDVIDCYNASNVKIDKCYFDGYFSAVNNEATFINVKSHGEQSGALASDAVRTLNTKITNCTFTLKGYGYAVRLGNFVRDGSVPILEKYKRLDISLMNNSFIFDGAVNPRGCIFVVGSLYNSEISHNTVYIKNAPVTNQHYYFLAITDSATSGDNVSNVVNIIANKVYVDLESTPVNFSFIDSGHEIHDLKLIANHIPSGSVGMNNTTRSRLINLIEIGNSFNRKVKGVTVDRPTLTVNDVGYEFTDTTIMKKIIWSGTTWVDSNGNTL